MGEMGNQAKVRSWRKRNGFLPRHKANGDGVVRAPMSLEIREVLREQRQAFIEKFGREPGPNDPVLFDRTKEGPTPIAFECSIPHQALNAMLAAGMDPMLIYATWKTGRMVTKENSKFLEDEELEEWLEACEWWKAIESGEVPPDPDLPAGMRPVATR